MIETLLGTYLFYVVFLYAPGLIVLVHPRAGAKFPLFWAVVVGAAWAVFASLQLLGFGFAAVLWTYGVAVLTTALVASALLARQHFRELPGQQSRKQVHF